MGSDGGSDLARCLRRPLSSHLRDDLFRLISFELLEKSVPRHGFAIRSPKTNDSQIGEVTSGNLSPILQKGIGMGYVSPAHAAHGSSLIIDIRGKAAPAVVVKPPFYKQKRPL